MGHLQLHSPQLLRPTNLQSSNGRLSNTLVDFLVSYHRIHTSRSYNLGTNTTDITIWLLAHMH